MAKSLWPQDEGKGDRNGSRQEEGDAGEDCAIPSKLPQLLIVHELHVVGLKQVLCHFVSLCLRQLGFSLVCYHVLLLLVHASLA